MSKKSNSDMLIDHLLVSVKQDLALARIELALLYAAAIIFCWCLFLGVIEL